MEKKFNVTINFEKYAKHHDNAPDPKMKNVDGMLMVTLDLPNNKTVMYNWNHVHSMIVQEAT